MAREDTPAKPIYPYTEWEVVEEGFNPQYNYRNETIFAVGNGYIGMRGSFEEGWSGPPGSGVDGTYLNGFYESEVIKYPEIAYGFAEHSQTMLNVTNGKIVKLYLEDEPFDMLTGKLLEYRRVLKLKEGLLQRTLVWRSPKGREARIDIKRLVSLPHKHLAAISYEVTPINFADEIRLVSILNGDVSNLIAEDDPRAGSTLEGRALLVKHRLAEGTFGAVQQRTKRTHFVLVCAMEHHIETDNTLTIAQSYDAFTSQVAYTVNAEQDKPIRLCKYVSYVTSLDYDESELMVRARDVVTAAKAAGFDHLQREQADFLAEFWSRADIAIKGDIALQQGIRFNMFHLLQSVGRDGRTNIAAKGLTGEGYEGHYFWDSEMYVVPFFLYNSPDISRKLLQYRYSILDKARERAVIMAGKGAMFAWRTINGEECSAYFPAGTAQYHINADIAFAIRQYVQATSDYQFLIDCGAEIVCETARMWADLGDYIPRKNGKFCINEVTGPDEYSAMVDNNCYTNMMARENLQFAVDALAWMKQHAPDDYQRLAARIGLGEREPEQWKKAADAMYIPYDDALKIYKQDDGFLDKAPWDFEHTPKENYPLLIHYHPLVIYRHQVCKQADLVLALFLLGHLFTLEEKRRNYDFYEKLTTHDSSLSTCTFSIVASEIGYHDKAYEYFMRTARMDLDDRHGNVKDGVHIANMAGTWMCLVNGFAGMRVYGDVLSLNPYLPKGWEEYSFNVTYRDCFLSVTVNQAGTTYTLLQGERLTLAHNGEKITLAAGEMIGRPLSEPSQQAVK
jgi:trehalose/maltose hydrolase-like predicted phosphorylase